MTKRKLLFSAILASAMALGTMAGAVMAQNAGINVTTAAKTTSEETKTLTIGIGAMAANLDPAQNPNGWYTIRYGVGETLTKLENGEIHPWLAKSWEMLDENTWKITINEATFHNGNPVDAAAVKASLERSIACGTRAAELFPAESMEADGQELIIKTTTPCPQLISNFVEPVFVIVDASETDASEGNPYETQPIATGPYMVSEYVPDESVTMVKNDNYWNGEPKVDQITFRTLSDTNTRLMALQSGEIDAAINLSTSSLVALQGNPDFTIDSVDNLRLHFAFLNQESGPMTDPALRKAVSYAVNRDSYANVVMSGYATPAVGIFSDQVSYGADKLSGYTYDPEKAKEILSEAGYTDSDNNGFLEKDGEELMLRIITYSSREELPLIAEAIQADLKAIGINGTVTNTDNNSEIWASGDFDISMCSYFNAMTGDSQYILQLIYDSEGETNHSRYNNPEVDALIDELAAEFDKEKRAELTIEIQQKIIDDAGYLFLVYPQNSVASSEKVVHLPAQALDFYIVDINTEVK